MREFTRDSTTSDVLASIDLTGQRIVVTGSSGGLGEESSRALAAAGASITMAARDGTKNAEAAERIRSGLPDADLELAELDLADLASVRAFADGFAADHDRLDVLVNNAGVMACPFGHTTDGFEMQFGTNHLGHFVLTGRLVPLLVASAPSRVVTLSSGAHVRSDIDFEDPNFETRDYDAFVSYGQSKTANALFALELNRRLADAGVLSFSVHPGMIATDLGRHMTPEMMEQMRTRASSGSGEAKAKAKAKAKADDAPDPMSMFKSVEAGASTEVWAATAPELAQHGGAYLGDCQLGLPGGPPVARGYAPHAADPDSARRLWSLSEDLVGERFEF